MDKLTCINCGLVDYYTTFMRKLDEEYVKNGRDRLFYIWCTKCDGFIKGEVR